MKDWMLSIAVALALFSMGLATVYFKIDIEEQMKWYSNTHSWYWFAF
jgi:hypothetical protein